MTFGEYIKNHRIDKRIPQKVMCEKLNISATYLCDIENDRRNPPEIEKLEKMIEVLELTKEETEIFYDLAGEKRDGVPIDLIQYIRDNEEVRIALRKARDGKASDKDWTSFGDKYKH